MFTHLHVASGYSMRYGAATPAALAEAAAARGMTALALTDRDGLYGAVKFVSACRDHGLAPLVGVDLAVTATGAAGGLPAWADPTQRVPAGGRQRVPVRGGATVDARAARVTVLAAGADPGRGLPAGAGWAALCRLVSAAHAGERGRPIADLATVAGHASRAEQPGQPGQAALLVLLGPESELGRAVLARRPDLATAVLRCWQQAMPPESLAIEVVCHHGPPDRPTSLAHAGRMLALARRLGVPAVLSNAVRYVDPDGAATVDVLDAARRLVPLDLRHVDRVSAQGYLAPPEHMAAIARAVAAAAGAPDERAEAARLLADTEALALRCRLDPGADLGMGTVSFPEPAVLGEEDDEGVRRALERRCWAAVPSRYPGAAPALMTQVSRRLETELRYIDQLGFAGFFLTVAEVCDLIRNELRVRVAARGSGAGSLVNHLLGISGVDPIGHNLLMERFLSPMRAQLPDIDIDVESARRTEVYQKVLGRFGAERVTCVSMMDTYRIRHAIRDVGAALGMPPAEIDAIATAFPHIRARDVRHALVELPELAASGLTSDRLDLLFDLVERLDGLPRHVALHPCGVVLSDAELLDRTPAEASWQGFPMSQFDKDDVEELGLLKLDILGIRMQSAMAYAVTEVARVEGEQLELDAIPLDDEATFRLVRTTHTLGCFQIESPGQRELVGKFGPRTFTDLVIDISLFRPGPVKSDMVTPFLHARNGWAEVDYLDKRLAPALADTSGVVVFHEQVLQIVEILTGCTLSQADEARRAMGSPQGQAQVKEWLWPLALANGFEPAILTRIWQVLEAFASFGFCRAHAAAFALPTYQSAWLKTHHPAAFLAGVLTHDPGMYPKRLILEDARSLGITVLPPDVNRSEAGYRVELIEPDDGLPPPGRAPSHPDLPDARGYGIRLALADLKGVSDAEVTRIVAGRPYRSLSDFWHRAQVSRPVVERLVLVGGFDSMYGLGSALPVARRDRVTRRDLLLQLAELDRWTRSNRRGSGPDQLTLELGDAPDETVPSGLPELTGAERVRAELDVLGMDVSRHVVDFYQPLLRELGVTRSEHLLQQRYRSELLVAGVKVATQTPPIRSGRRVVFLTLDDATGPVDATFFEDVQGPCAATVFHSWLLLVRGVLRRTGDRGVSLRATGAWDLTWLWELWSAEGVSAVLQVLAADPGPGTARPAPGALVRLGAGAGGGGAPGGSGRPGGFHAFAAYGGGFVVTPEQEREAAAAAAAATGLPAGDRAGDRGAGDRGARNRSGGMGGDPRQVSQVRRVLSNSLGVIQSPYADVGTPGADPRRVPRKLWHASPGSSGR